MTDDRTLRDRAFERAVQRWLDAGSDTPPPGAIDAVLRAIDRTPQERDLGHIWPPGSTGRLRRFGIAAALLALIAAASWYAAGGRLGVSPGPSPATPSIAPTSSSSSNPGPSSVAILDPSPDPNGPCLGGAVQIRAGGGALRASSPILQAPPGGSIAVVVMDSATAGSILLADGATKLVRAAATFTGIEQEVDIVGSSTDGRTLLISAGHLSLAIPARDCHNLFLVAADGSEVTKLTNNGPATFFESQALSPDGRLVAIAEPGAGAETDADTVRIVDPSGAAVGPVTARCGGPGGGRIQGLTWSPDDTELAIQCSLDLLVQTVPGGDPVSLHRPIGFQVLSVAWSTDGSRLIVAVTAPTSGLAPVDAYSVDPVAGTWTRLGGSTNSADWVTCCPEPAISPNERWLLALDGADPMVPYVVDLDSIRARVWPWVPWPGPALQAISWLPDGNSLLFGERTTRDPTQETLFVADLLSLTRTAVGSIPAGTFAWHAFVP